MNRPTASFSEFQRSQANVTILLIEDAETDRVTYARYLQSDPHHQYSVFNADKLQTGMALWRSQSPDVVLLDVNLPDGSGLEFLQFLQSNWAKAKWVTKMPVIVLTGQGSEQVAVQAMKLGAMEYLNKNDITADSLRKSLGEVIEYQTQLQQKFQQQQVEDRLRERNRALEAQVAQQAAALQESKARLQEIEHIARLGHWQFDLLTGKITWSREIFYIFRLDPNQPEPTFEQIFQYFSEADRQRIEAAVQRAVQTGESYELDVPFTRADGSPGCLFLRGNIIYDKQGQVVGRMGILMDISERYYIQAELRSLSDRLTLALESAAIGTWDWDLVHEAYWDERMYALYGLEHLQRPITYQDWANALHPDDRARVEQELELSLTQGKVDSEFRIVLPNGSIRFIKVMGLMHYDQLGQPQRMVGINYDITARKQVETTLALYTREVEDLYDKAPCGYHSLDSEGRYIRVNETELQWLGYAREEMLGQPFTAFLTEASRQIFFESYPDFRQRGWVKNLEFDMICKDNSILPVLVNATAVKDENGVYIYSRSTLLDTRDRRQIEQQLQQTNAELLRATRLKDEFLANMSHELRTPLNAILGMSESLLDGILGAVNSQQMKAVTTIENSGKYLLELINDILDLAKISSGKMELILAPVSVQYLCNSSLPFIRQQALQKNIQIGCNIPHNINEAILDERRIRQVLINLLTNAVKFTPEDGQITLEVKHQSTEAAEGSCAWLLFSVIDTGVGIAPADVSRLFQPFVQVDSRLNRQQVGTGLGLAMVKQITELHGGYVTVDSQPGQGSCFTIALPYQLPDVALLPDAPLQSTVPPAVIPEQSERAIAPMILLAEDNQANIATFTAYLSARHYRMIVAQDGEEAVAMAKAEQPDLILMDIQMPELDGLEAIRQIRADEQLSAIPIIALTALAMPEDQVRCIVAGANQYLSKPVKLKQLAEAIRQWLPR